MLAANESVKRDCATSLFTSFQFCLFAFRFVCGVRLQRIRPAYTPHLARRHKRAVDLFSLFFISFSLSFSFSGMWLCGVAHGRRKTHTSGRRAHTATATGVCIDACFLFLLLSTVFWHPVVPLIRCRMALCVVEVFFLLWGVFAAYLFFLCPSASTTVCSCVCVCVCVPR